MRLLRDIVKILLMQCSFIIVGYVGMTSKMLSGDWQLKSPLQNSLHTTRTMNPCRGEFIRLSINRIRGYFYFSYLATEVAPTKALLAIRIMRLCRGEFIRLSISRIRRYFDFSYLATEVAPTKFLHAIRIMSLVGANLFA
jgi:hypothetical protein